MSIVDRTGTMPPRKHDSEAVSLASLMDSIIDGVGPQSIALPDEGQENDLCLYRLRVNNLLRDYQVPVDLDERKRRGRETRLRALTILKKLSDIGTSTRSTTARQWYRLYRLAQLCARDQDWCSTTGPVIGATGDKLRHYLAVRNLRDIFDPLLASGVIVPHRQRGNGRRYFTIINAGTGSERIDASGWSLAPLMFVLDELEILHAHENDLLEERCTLPTATKNALKDVRNALRPHKEANWAQKLWADAAELGRRANNARKGCIEKLRTVEREAHALRLLVESTVDKIEFEARSGAVPTHSSGETIPDIYDSNYHAGSSNCSAGRRSEEQVLPPSPDPALERDDNQEAHDDPFGIERSGFKITEVADLFPFSEGLFDLTVMRADASPYAVSRLMSVSQSAVTRSLNQIGLVPTLLCLLITGQHASDGEIRSTPEIYFNGLIKKARLRDLNIGHTIFGRRAVAGTQRSKHSAINYVGTDICYG